MISGKDEISQASSKGPWPSLPQTKAKPDVFTRKASISL